MDEFETILMTGDEKKFAIEGFLNASAQQTDLLLTLAVSVAGGSVALLVQLALFNRQNHQNRFVAPNIWLLGTSIFFLCTSCVLAYLCLGNLTSLRIPLVAADIDPSVSIASQKNIPGLSAYRVLSVAHFLSFMIGVLFSILFWLLVARNIRWNSS